MKFLNLLLLISLLVSVISFVSGANLKEKNQFLWLYDRDGKCKDNWTYDGSNFKGCSSKALWNGKKWCETSYYHWKYCE